MAQTPLRLTVGADVALPDLADLTPGDARWESAVETVENAYQDTAECDLLRAGAALVRFTAGSTGGWRLELPGGPERVVADRARAAEAGGVPTVPTVPTVLAAATLGIRRGRELRQVATVRVHRTLHRLIDADGERLLEIADETVHSSASTPDGARLDDWRRWELTFTADGFPPVAAVTDRLAGAAGDPGDTGEISDVRRAVLGTGAEPSPATAQAGEAAEAAKNGKGRKQSKQGRRRPSVTAGQLILAYLRAQDDALVAGDLMLRNGSGGIHPTRVATRRLRSTLRIFRPYVDADRAAAFDTELSWYAATLGEVRDREVQRVRMRALLDEIPDELVLGPVGSSIDATLRSEELTHRGRLAEALDSERYLALMREAHLWSTTPPFTDRAAADAEVLRKRVSRAADKLAAHLAAGLRAGGDDEELHSARKAGKRARYAAELAAPVLGKKGAKLVARYQEIQDVLGDFQDGVVACALIRRLATATVGKRRENGFTYGLLYSLEQQRATVGRERAGALYAQLRD